MQQTISAERTVQLVKRSPLNPLRRVLRKPLPTYAAPLFAEALVTTEREGDMPSLRIEDRGQGRFGLALVAKPGVEYVVSRVTLRERGTSGGYFATPDVQRRTTHEQGLRDAGQRLGDGVRLLVEGMADGRAQGGVVKPTTVLAGAERGGEAFVPADRFRVYDPRPQPVPGVYAPRVDPAATDDAKYAWAGLDPATETPPEAPTLTGKLVGTVILDGLDSTTAPTSSTSVLHDLQHVAELLETAQFEIAMSPGGDAAGTTGNSAWKALNAVQTIQAKLAVMADAADLAAQEVTDAQRRAEAQRPDIDTGVKRNLNRAASMLRMVTDRLPMTKDV